MNNEEMEKLGHRPKIMGRENAELEKVVMDWKKRKDEELDRVG